MPRTCTICRHSQREEIDKALISNEPYRAIAVRYGTSAATLQRHQPHMSREVIKVHEAAEVARSERLLDCVKIGEGRAERMYGAAEAIMARALESQDLRTALQAIRTAAVSLAEARQFMVLRGELTRELGKERLPPPSPDARIVITRDPPPVEAPTPRALLPPPDVRNERSFSR